MNPSDCDLVLSLFPFAPPNLDILGMKFDSELTFDARVSSIVSRFSQRINILKLLKRVCVGWAGFALIRVSCHCVIDVMLLDCVLYKVNSNSNHCLFSWLQSASTSVRQTRAAVADHLLEFEVSTCRISQFATCFLPAEVCLWIDLSYTINWLLLPRVLLFFSFPSCRCLGVAKAIYKKYVFFLFK